MRLMQPIIHQALTTILAQDFNLTPTAAAKAATKLYAGLQRRDLDVIRGCWQEDTTPVTGGGRTTPWDEAAQIAAAWETAGIKPWEMR